MRTLKVQGIGRAAAPPDLVTLSFGVEALAPEYEKSLEVLHRRTEDLRRGISASGLDRAELRTTGFGVRVEHEYKAGKTVFVGYKASHHLHIEIPMDKDQLNQVLEQIAIGHSGATVGLSFSVRDKETLRKTALADAVRTAKENAETLASAAGVTMGKLQQLDYGWAEVRFYEQEADILCESMSESSAHQPDIEPEDVSAQERVTLIYEIAD